MNKRQVKKRGKVQEHSRTTNTNPKIVKKEELIEVALTTIESDIQEENKNIEKNNETTKDTSKKSIKVKDKVEEVKDVVKEKVEQAIQEEIVEPKLSLSIKDNKINEVEDVAQEVIVEDAVEEAILAESGEKVNEEVIEAKNKDVEPVEVLEVEEEVIIEDTKLDEIAEEAEKSIEEYKIPDITIEEPSVEDIKPEEYLSIINEKEIKLFTVKKVGYTSYEVKALLKNLNYFKTVKIKYTTDSWETYKEADLNYISNEANGLEMWGNVIDINSYTPEKAEFVLYYGVNGADYWDNNEKNNYRFV